jgi:hypothetical protein
MHPKSNYNYNRNGKANYRAGSSLLYWMVRLMVAVWMVEPPVAVTVMA